MTTRMYHWCPNGCGKSAVVNKRYKDPVRFDYKCNRCENIYTRKEIEEF